MKTLKQQFNSAASGAIVHLRGRERALEGFGWAGRQAEWIALACLHGGVFTRAQWTSFLGCHHEKVRRAVRALVAQGVAVEEDPPGIDGIGRVCRIHARRICRALGAGNRRRGFSSESRAHEPNRPPCVGALHQPPTRLPARTLRQRDAALHGGLQAAVLHEDPDITLDDGPVDPVDLAADFVVDFVVEFGGMGISRPVGEHRSAERASVRPVVRGKAEPGSRPLALRYTLGEPHARAEEGGIELWVSGRLGAQGIDGGKLMPVVTVGLNERRRVGDGTEEVGYHVRLSRCGAQVGGDHRRWGACLRVGAAATVLGQAFGDDQTGLGRGLWAQGKEIPPLSRYALRVSRELFIQGLDVGGVLAVERLFVHRFRCSRGAFLRRPLKKPPSAPFLS